jgi:hypothetical protein
MPARRAISQLTRSGGGVRAIRGRRARREAMQASPPSRAVCRRSRGLGLRLARAASAGAAQRAKASSIVSSGEDRLPHPRDGGAQRSRANERGGSGGSGHDRSGGAIA